ncbi:uncharacterized protein LOC132338426 isoform X2 [Haemorhous mexicanus]|uniref:uncharacterized protein LOC132338426 isoform X2 n=1 Tax=Haemorhous mexicanus TaxID=30427 RepID=UPI0028BE23C0|nr:uncharacterized protein LOC132338426 isoform X2 [Haemorhous mexicanus]
MRRWPHCRVGQDQACDRAGTSLGVPTCEGDVLAPRLLKSRGESRESRQRGGIRGVAPGWVWPIIPHPASPPPAFPQGHLRGMSHFRQKAASQLLCIPGLHSPHAKEVVLPCCPIPPCPHVPKSVHSCRELGCTYSQWQGRGVLLFSAACCASPGCTSRKHRASHDHGTGSCHAAPRCQPQTGPPRGAHTTGRLLSPRTRSSGASRAAGEIKLSIYG